MTENMQGSVVSDDPFDREYLRKNYLDLGCDDVLQDVYRIFQESSLTKLAGLRKAANLGSLEELLALSHGLKGESGSVGGRYVSALAARMERAARDGDPDAARNLLPELEAELSRLLKAIERELAA